MMNPAWTVYGCVNDRCPSWTLTELILVRSIDTHVCMSNMNYNRWPFVIMCVGGICVHVVNMCVHPCVCTSVNEMCIVWTYYVLVCAKWKVMYRRSRIMVGSLKSICIPDSYLIMLPYKAWQAGCPCWINRYHTAWQCKCAHFPQTSGFWDSVGQALSCAILQIHFCE